MNTTPRDGAPAPSCNPPNSTLAPIHPAGPRRTNGDPVTRTRRTLAALAVLTAWCVLVDKVIRGLHGCDECEGGR